MYDCVLTFGQEVELVWRQRWSLMTIMYLSVRYLGILYAVTSMLIGVPTIPMTDAVSFNMYVAIVWTILVVFAMTGVIMMTRLYAMYQRSRKVLILLIVVLLAINIVNGVIYGIETRHASGEVYIVFGTYMCAIDYGESDQLLLTPMIWILTMVWEVLALLLAVWIAVKHFRELRRSSTGGFIGDCFTVLLTNHVVYFASFAAASSFELGYLLSIISADPYSLQSQIVVGVAQIFLLAQYFVLGPRLILSVRNYHAKLVDDSDAATAMTSIAFQEHVHVSTSSSV
ncbi:uncharacterized protein EDB91DRAFT_467771 [Suillus paluster]|uniref:uncharacterized protein n=1 Tax=Suillus paluster TaxID=48578 RepID=UPI001B85EF44|nr:uncharacterized protein EDB91DRAFT_467771 [Suillus paluster]KAG1719343.1 hypothetical protein EDB91DRAFT_467771 [Suillus paluster]